MPTAPLVDFQSYFAEIEDPRVERTRRYELLDIIVIAVCAVTRTDRPTARQSNAPAGGWCGVCSADDWVDVEGWGNAKLDWLRQQGLPLLNGIPPHDTFGDVFGRLKPEQVETSFLRWVQVWVPAEEKSSPHRHLQQVQVLTVRRCAVRTTAAWAKAPFIWSVPGPALTICCWARSKSTRNPMKLRLFQPY